MPKYKKKKNSAANNSRGAFEGNWDIEKYKDEHECEEHWQLRKAFMEKWKKNFPEERLICLARVYTNIEFMGCRYPAPVMEQIAQLSFEVGQKYKDKKKTKLQRTFVSASTAAEDRARGIKRVGGEIVTDDKPKSTCTQQRMLALIGACTDPSHTQVKTTAGLSLGTQTAELGNTGPKVPLTHPLSSIAPQANLSQLDVTGRLTSAGPSLQLAALVPTALAAAHAPPDTTMTATSALTDTQTSAPPTLTKVIPSTMAWQQNIVRNSIKNNPDNDTDDARVSSLEGELRALVLQRQQKIEARLREIASLWTKKEVESGGPGFIYDDEVRLLKKLRSKIRNKERIISNRLRKIREGNSQRNAQTVACKGVRDQPQVREGETQREKQPDAETCGQGLLREGETQRGTSLPAPGPSGENDQNRTEVTQGRQRNRKRGKRAGLLHKVSLAQKTVPMPSEPQPGPSGQGLVKRVHPDDTASPNTLQGDAKRIKIQTAQGEQRTYARATKDIPARLAVAICLSPPSRDMTTDEAEHIKLSLENLFMDADPSKPLPAFRGYPRVANGTVQMWCEDDSALTWLTQNVPKIKLPKTDATLTVLRQSDVTTRVRASLFVPRYNGDIALLQNILTRQNPWYDIGRWSLYRATSVGGINPGTYMTLGIPSEEAAKVLERERRVSYLLGSIYVRFSPNTHPSDTQTKTTDTEMTKRATTELDLTMSQLEEEMAMADADAISMPTSPPGWTNRH